MTELITSAQISVYPLRQAELHPAVEAVRRAPEGSKCVPEVGPQLPKLCAYT